MKNLTQHINEKLQISRNSKQYTDGFTENLLCEFYDEDEYNFEKYGEILFNGHLFGLYRYILNHNSSGVPIKQLHIMTSPAVYGSIVVKDKNEELSMVRIGICNELVKIFDVSNHQIYAETYRNYVEDMTGTTVEDWVAQPEFIDWLNKVTEISGHKFYTYDLDQYKA
jgi:hypothetical protein